MRIYISFILCVVSLLSAGCQVNAADGGAPVESTASPMVEPVFPTEGVIAMTPSLSTPDNPALQSLIEKAKADLAQRLQVPIEEIVLVESTSVTWPDSSLGCPQPGMFYTQVLTVGYLFLLEVNGKTYEYHANRDTYVIFCENPSPPVPGMQQDR